MITLFRRLRQQFIDSGNITKYLLYAIGEILLVVIGILIALQVNNWNEERRIYSEEQAILSNLNKEFKENKMDLNVSIEEVAQTASGLREILDVTLQQEITMNFAEADSLIQKSFGHPSWTPSSFVLIDLKNSGRLSKLNNSVLVNMLFEWDRKYVALEETYESYKMYARQYYDYVTYNGSIRNLDALDARMQDLKKSTIAPENIILFKDAVYENHVDNFYFLAILLLDNYREAEALMESIIEETN